MLAKWDSANWVSAMWKDTYPSTLTIITWSGVFRRTRFAAVQRTCGGKPQPSRRADGFLSASSAAGQLSIVAVGRSYNFDGSWSNSALQKSNGTDSDERTSDRGW
ncbi:hypothetical protein ACI65C_004625 [Semiaphis heraclei]